MFKLDNNFREPSPVIIFYRNSMETVECQSFEVRIASGWALKWLGCVKCPMYKTDFYNTRPVHKKKKKK